MDSQVQAARRLRCGWKLGQLKSAGTLRIVMRARNHLRLNPYQYCNSKFLSLKRDQYSHSTDQNFLLIDEEASTSSSEQIGTLDTVVLVPALSMGSPMKGVTDAKSDHIQYQKLNLHCRVNLGCGAWKTKPGLLMLESFQYADSSAIPIPLSKSTFQSPS